MAVASSTVDKVALRNLASRGPPVLGRAAGRTRTRSRRPPAAGPRCGRRASRRSAGRRPARCRGHCGPGRLGPVEGGEERVGVRVASPIPRSRTRTCASRPVTRTTSIRSSRAVLDRVGQEVVEQQLEVRPVGLDDHCRAAPMNVTRRSLMLRESVDRVPDDVLEDLRLSSGCVPEPRRVSRSRFSMIPSSRSESSAMSVTIDRPSPRPGAPPRRGAGGRCRRSSSPASAARARPGPGTRP